MVRSDPVPASILLPTSPVTVGDGAVIAARAVVASDVEQVAKDAGLLD